jgi:hypothetical protein
MTPSLSSLLSYRDFVLSRVKWLGSFPLDFHHAVTGLCGEAIEFQYATSLDNEIEEHGDMEFYYHHALLALEMWGYNSLSPIKYHHLPHSYLPIIKIAGDLLDFGKKIWIYGEDPRDLPIHDALREMEKSLSKHALRFSREISQAKNRAKLERRYPSGYTDAAAQARADKPAGE